MKVKINLSRNVMWHRKERVEVKTVVVDILQIPEIKALVDQGYKISDLRSWQLKSPLEDKLCDSCNNHIVNENSRSCKAGNPLNPYIWGCVTKWEQKK